MTELKFFNLLPMFIFIILFMLYTLRFLYKSDSKRITKMIFVLLGYSTFFIILFTFFYMVICTLDIENAKSVNDKITGDMLRNIKGIDFNVSQGKAYLIFLDLLLFSASTFFHVQSNMYIVGVGQILVLIEGFLGIILLITVPYIFIKKNDEDNDQIDLLYIYLNRGWNIFRIRKFNSNTKHRFVELLGPKKEMRSIVVKNTRNVKDLFDKFKVDWNFVEIDMVPLFIKALDEILYSEDSDLANEAIVLYSQRNNNNGLFYIQAKQFLEKIQYKKCFSDSEVNFEDIESIIRLLKKETDTSEDSMNEVSNNE